MVLKLFLKLKPYWKLIKNLYLLSTIKNLKDLEATSAAAVLISKEYINHCKVDYILVENPHESYAKLTQLFSGNLRKKISNKNYADSYSKDGIEIGKNVFIGKNVIIEKGTKINSGSFIGDDVFIGEETYIHPNVCLYHSVRIGKKYYSRQFSFRIRWSRFCKKRKFMGKNRTSWIC